MRKAIVGCLACLAMAGCGSTDNSTGPAADDSTVGAGKGAAGDEDADPQALETSGLYPGSTAGAVTDRYVSSAPIDQVFGWYREDAARRAEGLIFSSEKHKDGYLVVGNDTDSLKSFLIYLVPAQGGGTELRLYPFDYVSKGGTL